MQKLNFCLDSFQCQVFAFILSTDSVSNSVDILEIYKTSMHIPFIKEPEGYGHKSTTKIN